MQVSKLIFADSSATTVARMMTRLFSSLLDPQKPWYALSDELCEIPPRKFCSNGIFNLFPEEVCRVNINLRGENGGPVPLSCFNRGAKGTDTLYAGTAFTFKSSLFERLRKVLNKAELVGRANECETSESSSCSSRQICLENSSDRLSDSNNLSDQSAKDSSLFSHAEEDVSVSDLPVVAKHF